MPEGHSLGLYSGSQLLQGCATRAVCAGLCQGLALAGPAAGAPSPRLPTLLCCSDVSTLAGFADGCTTAEVVLSFFQGLVFFQGLDVHMLSPGQQAWAWGAQICVSLRSAFTGKCRLTAAGIFPGVKGQDKDSV